MMKKEGRRKKASVPWHWKAVARRYPASLSRPLDHPLLFLYQSFLSTSDLGKSSNQWNKWCPEESMFSFIKNFLLKYSCFIMFCQFLVYSKVDQLHVYIDPFIFGFPSHLGHHRPKSSESTSTIWVEFPVLYSRFSLVIHIHIYSSVYVSILMFQIYPSPTPASPQ